MDWQLGLVLLIVVCAAWYLGRQTWRTWAGSKTGCGGGCDCGSKTVSPGQETLIPPEQLSLRLRKPSSG